MEKVLTFIIENPAWAIIILLVIYLFLREFGVKNIFKVVTTIRGTQEKKYPELEKSHLEIMQELHKQNITLAEQNRKFATNHALHEIPDIKADVGEIKKTLSTVVEIQRTQGLDIATLIERSKK